MKQVFLIGDSILGNYCPDVEEILAGKAQIHRPCTAPGQPENGRWSGYTLNNLVPHMWLQHLPEKIDCVHWNNGIWDMFIRHDEDGCFTPLDDYVRNLRRIARELRKLTPNVVFATSTPLRVDGYILLPYQSPRRIMEYELPYRDAAIALMKELNIPVNDLFAAVLPRRMELICEDNTHLSDAGKRFCAEKVVEAISPYLA